MKFKSDIEVQAGLRDGGNDIGTAGQILSSTGSQTNWIDQDSIVASEAKLVVIECKNTSGSTISKGTPVYQTGTVGATDVIEIDVADASDEDKMAAIGLLQSDLANNAFGKVVITGELLNIITSPIDGVTPVTGDTIYVKSGGGLTLTKPTGVNFIQNIGLVGKVSGGSAGSITVSSIMRSNDVPTPLYIDHTNQRLGIGTTSPQQKLQVASPSSTSVVLGASYLSTNNNNFFEVGILANDGYLNLRNSGVQTTVHIDSDGNSFFNGGNVGIGTTSPNDILQVNQGSAAFRGITIEGTSPALYLKDTQATNAYHIGSNGNYLYFLEDSNQSGGYNNIMAFWDPSNNFIFSLGNVGIGTSTPSQKLHVVGNARVTGAYYDSNNSPGTANQVLVSTVTGTDWVDGSGSSIIGGPYLPLAGGTMTGTAGVTFPDDFYLYIGTSNDLRIYHNSTNGSNIWNTVGNLTIQNTADNQDIYFKNDNGAGGNATYFYLDGSLTNGTTILGATRFPDNSKIFMGTGGDLVFNHDGTNSFINNLTGDFTIENAGDDLILKAADDLLLYVQGTEIALQAIGNGKVGLRYNNVEKFETTSTGVSVTGDIQIDSALLSNQENTDVDTGTETVANVAIATYTAAFFDFVIKKTTNVRSGTVYACHDGTNVEFTETSTQDLGDTSDVTLSVDISGGNMRLLATVTSDDWSVKSLIRAI